MHLDPRAWLNARAAFLGRATLTAVCIRSNHAAHSRPARPRAPIPPPLRPSSWAAAAVCAKYQPAQTIES